MAKEKRPGRSATALLALLKAQDFQRDALQFYRAVVKVRPTMAELDFPKVAEELAAPFLAKWGVRPPPSSELVSPDSRRKYVDAIASGRWTVVPIYPWTRQQQIEDAIRRARKTLGKEHQDRAAQERRVQQAAWLDACDIPGPEIAKAVWGRRHGLRRRSKGQATAAMSYQAEERLLKGYLEKGYSYEAAELLVLQRARGSEAPASAAMRVASDRYYRSRLNLNADFAVPRVVDERSHALTMLFRATHEGANEDQLRQRIEVLQNAFLNSLIT
jgi:hypothetical protein